MLKNIPNELKAHAPFTAFGALTGIAIMGVIVYAEVRYAPELSTSQGLSLAEVMDAWVADGLVEFLGFADDVRPLLHDCSVYCLPSYREGTPRTVLEALAVGRAVITTDAPGCRETVIDRSNGFLVPVRDGPALATAMKNLCRDPDLVRSMGDASRQLAESKYDVVRVNAAIRVGMGLEDSGPGQPEE